MKAFIIQFPFGVAAFDDKKALIDKALFAKKPQAAARSLLKTESGKLSDEVFSLVTLLKNAGYDTFVFENTNLPPGRLNVSASPLTGFAPKPLM